MKRSLSFVSRYLIIGLALLFISNSSFASHVVGGDIYYTHVGGLQYRLTVVLYGDCGIASSGAFATLDDGPPTPAAPQICIYDGATLLPSMPFRLNLTGPGVEITPVCPDSLSRTQCTNTSYAIEGIKKFVYSAIFTLPYASANWRFVFNSHYGPSSAGRAAAITNIVGPGGTLMELTATLNNTVFDNTSPSLTVVPTPFFCLNTPICYTPGAIDSDMDSLRFDLIGAMNAGPTMGTCVAGTPCAYTGIAYGATPVSATTPLRCAAGSYSFSTVNGQICFNPNFLQRSIVVYNVSEYRSGILVGTCQREMTFLVRGCTSFGPTPGFDTTGGVLTKDGPNSYHVCGNAGAFSLTTYPRPDTTVVPPLNLTCTATGLPPGMSFSVIGNGTPTPTCTFTGNASLMVPGVYTFFLKLKDNACPLNGELIVAYTISIYPVPAITASISTPLQCTANALISVVPGGQGDPWTIKVVNTSLTPPLDTVSVYTTSGPITDSRGPGTYNYVIFTNVSTECALMASVTVDQPPLLVAIADTVHPSYCGKNDGAVIIYNLNAGGIDTITYDRYGVAQPPIIAVVSSAGAVTIPNLRAGVYSNIVIHYGYCTALPIGPVTLIDPPFTLRATSYQDPTKCGFCDGWIKLHGLHPSQLDTVTFNRNGIPQPPVTFYVTSDSTIKIPGLCDSVYTTFTVKTAGVCTKTLLDVLTLAAPPLDALFDTVIHYGCKGDTLELINNSIPASDLTYSWDFGDGGTATGINPTHIYTNTVGSNYIVKLFATNTKCLDSAIVPISLNHFVKSDFSMNPPVFLCQIDPVTYTNLSTGTTVDYRWYFADGVTDTTTNIVHSYTNMGTYSSILVAHNNTFGVDCYDTMRRTIVVDSNSILSLNVTGDVTAICRGQAVTLSAIYTTSGEVSNGWSLTDGFKMVNVNPLTHSLEGIGDFTVNFNAKFRACPEKNGSMKIHVFDVPSLYLGPDTAICPGSSPIVLSDDRNYGNGRAKWRWNTDEKERSSKLVVTKPGMYAATVTIDGCTMSDTVYVNKDCYVDVPNVFTPNGDGVNDFFFPRNLLTRGVVKFNMSIYSRWGQLVYETSRIDGQGWDGAMNATPQASGVYIYSIDATFKDGMIEQHKGNVTLLR